MTKKIIFISGLVASGKDTLGRELGQALNYTFLMVGGIYRLVADQLINSGVSIDTVTEAQSDQVVNAISNDPKLWNKIDDNRLGSEIHGQMASRLSRFQNFRKQVFLLQEQFISLKSDRGVILSGQDCGTWVDDERAQRIFLLASIKRRAHRRSQQLGISFDAANSFICSREQADQERQAYPLMRPTKSHLCLDSTDMSIKEMVEISLCYLR